MPTTTDTIPQVLFLMDEAGVPLVYANKAAFTGAGWNLSWQDDDGVALASQPTYTLSAGEATGRHVVGFSPPIDAWTVKITKPSTYRSDPWEFSGEATVYSLDDIFGAFVSGSGEAITETTTTGDVDIYDGNSIVIDLSVLEAALTAVGATSLADCTTLLAEIKLLSLNSDDPATVSALTESILSDTSGDRVVRAYVNTFPSELAVPDDVQTLAARCDLRITKGALTITAAIRNVTIRWKANT